MSHSSLTGPCSAVGSNPLADSKVTSLIQAQSHTFVKIENEIISLVILLLLLIQEGLLSVASESMCTKYWLTAWSSLPRKKCG